MPNQNKPLLLRRKWLPWISFLFPTEKANIAEEVFEILFVLQNIGFNCFSSSYLSLPLYDQRISFFQNWNILLMYNTHTNRLLNGKIPCLLRQWFLILFYTENTYTSREMITALTSVRTKKCSKNQKLTKIAPFFPPNFFPLPNWWFQAQREKN